MINAILIINNHGKPRLQKFYQYFKPDEQQQIINETFHLIAKREEQNCNFLEIPKNFLLSSKTSTDTNKLIFRHYATLFFIFCVDSAESELGILDLIQVFVEALDRSFQNVCELDLIFNSDAIHWLLDEIVQSGMVLETNINNVISKFEEQNKIARVECSLTPSTAKAASAIKNINLPQLKKSVRDLPNTFKDLKF